MRLRLAVAMLALAVALAIPLRLSADVWAYAAYGALVAHHLDPWAHAHRAAEIAPLHDPLLSGALAAWSGSIPRDVYGPLFTLPCALVVVLLHPFDPGATIFTLRMIAAICLLACIAVASRTRPALAPFLAFHPVVLWTAAEGHNDVFWLALVLAADRIPTRYGRAATLAAAALVKAVAIVPLAWALRASAERWRIAAACAAALLAGYGPLLWSILAHGLDHSDDAPRVSLLHASALSAWSQSPAPLATGAVLALLAVVGIARGWRSGDRIATCALLGWVALPGPEAWYAVWFLPIVAMVRPSPARTALLAATFCGTFAYIQDAVSGTALHNPSLLVGIMLALYAVPLLLAALLQAPEPQPQAPPGAPAPGPTANAPIAMPTASPAPTPTPTPSDTIPPEPVRTPSPSPSPTPNLFGYVIDPPTADNVSPRIVEIAVNDRTVHAGQMILVKVTTSSNVTRLFARTLGRQIAIPLMSPGLFAGQQQLPSGIPFFLLNRTYQIDIIASTDDGKTTTYTLPLRLEH